MAPNDPAWTIGGSEPLHRDMGAKASPQRAAAADADEVDEAAIRAFIERYEGIDHHPRG